MNELIAIALSWALLYVDYPNPHTLPDYEFRTTAQLQELYCPATKKCSPWAVYGDDNVLLLNSDVKWKDNSVGLAIMAHELTHYLQDLDGQTLACDEITEREREGYYVQGRVLTAYGRHLPAGIFPTLSCVPEEEIDAKIAK